MPHRNLNLNENSDVTPACKRRVMKTSFIVFLVMFLLFLAYLFLRKGCIYDKDTCKELYDQGYEAGKKDASTNPNILYRSKNANNNRINSMNSQSRLGSSILAGSNGVVIVPGFVLETQTHALRFQHDGNLVIVNRETGQPISSSRTYGNPEKQAVRGEFSSHGLRLWNSQGREIWAISPKEPGDLLTISKDGNLEIIQSSTQTPVWMNSLDSVRVRNA